MAKKLNPYINYTPKKIKARPKGYQQKIHLKLSKRVHDDFKKMGIKSTWNESQKFASKVLYQKYKNENISDIRVTELDTVIQRNVKQEFEKENVPIREIVEECGSVFSVPISDLTLIEWYDVGNALRLIPDDVKIRVSGGNYGSINISKKSEVEYHSSGISEIVNKIRNDVNNDSGSDIVWEGITKLVPGRKDNGSNCNYFIDFVLEINGDLVFTSEKEVIKEEEIPSFGPEEIQSRIMTKKQIEKESKIRREEAKLKREQNKIEKDKIEAAKKRKRAKEAPKEEPVKQDFAKILELLRKDYDDGLLSVKEYKKERARILKKLDNNS